MAATPNLHTLQTAIGTTQHTVFAANQNNVTPLHYAKLQTRDRYPVILGKVTLGHSLLPTFSILCIRPHSSLEIVQ